MSRGLLVRGVRCRPEAQPTTDARADTRHSTNQALDLSISSSSSPLEQRQAKDTQAQVLAKRAMETSSRLYQESFARDDRLLHMQSEALEQEREKLTLQAARVLPQSARLLVTRRSLSPSHAIERLSTPKSRASVVEAWSDSKSKQPGASTSPKSRAVAEAAAPAAWPSPGVGVVSQRLQRLSQPRARDVGKALDLSVDVSQIPIIARAQATLNHVGQWPCGPSSPSPNISTQQDCFLSPAGDVPARGRANAADADMAEGGSAGVEQVSPTRPPAVSAGVGIQLTQKKNDTFVIDCVPAGGPAAVSGKIEAGDELIAVDGVKIGGRDMAFVASRITGAPDTTVKLSLLRRAFTRGSHAERRRQFVVSVTRKVPPGQAAAGAKGASLVPILPLGANGLGQQGAKADSDAGGGQAGRQRFKSPRNHEREHGSGSQDDTLSPLPPHEPRFKSPRNHEPLVHLAHAAARHSEAQSQHWQAPPNRGALPGDDESSAAQGGARARLFVDQERGAPDEWYAKLHERESPSKEAAAPRPPRAPSNTSKVRNPKVASLA